MVWLQPLGTQVHAYQIRAEGLLNAIFTLCLVGNMYNCRENVKYRGGYFLRQAFVDLKQQRYSVLNLFFQVLLEVTPHPACFMPKMIHEK